MPDIGFEAEKVTIIVEAKDEASGKLDKVSGSLGRLGSVAKIAGGIGLAAVGAGVAAVGGILSQTVPLAIDFESAITSLGIAAGESGLSLDELHDAALEVGGDARLLGVDASGAAESMTGLYKAGLSTTEIFGDLNAYMEGTAELGGALRASIDLAAATELDMVQASDLAAVALATFGAELETETERAGFVTDAMDYMVRAADASVAEVSGLRDALGTVGPVAAGIGIGFEDLNTALAILSTRGIEGSQAGTALKSMLTNLQRPTDDVKDAYRELGVTMYDAQGAFVGLPNLIDQLSGALYGTRDITVEVGGRTKEQNDLLEKAQDRYAALTGKIEDHNLGMKTLSDDALEKANKELAASAAVIEELSGITGTATTTTKQLTDEERNLYIQTLAGTYGMNALNTLVAEGTPGWEAMGEAISEATGIQEQAERRAATFAGRMEALGGVLEELKIRVGEAVLPVLADLVNFLIEKGIPWLDQFVEPWTKLWEWIGGLVEKITEFDWSLRNLFTTFEDGSTVWDGFFEALGFSEEQAQKLGQTINNVVLFLNNLLIGAIDFGTKVGEYLAPVWEWVRQNLELKDVLLAIGAILAPVIIPAIIGLGTAIAGALLAAAPLVLQFAALVAIFYLVREAWEENWYGIRDTLTQLWYREIRPRLLELRDWLEVKIPQAIEAMRDWWENELVPALQSGWAWIQENLVPTFNDIYTWLQENIPEAIATVKTWFETDFMDAVTKVQEFIEDPLIPTIEEIWDWLQENIPQAIENANEAWAELEEQMTDVWDWIQENLIPIFEDIRDWLKENIPKAINNAIEAWEDLHDQVSEVWGFIDTYLIPIFWDLHDIFVGVLNAALVLIVGWFKILKEEAIEPVWEFIEEWLFPVVRAFGLWLIDHLAPNMETARDWFDKLTVSLGPVKDLLEKVHKWLRNVANVLDSLPQVLPSWLTHSSPTPLELGLRGINDALVSVNPNLARFNQLTQATGRYPAPSFAGSVGPGGRTEIHNHYHLNVATGRSAGRVTDDFDIMKALAGT